MMTLREQLLKVADTYCAAVGRARASVSTPALNQGSKLDRIAAGGDLGTRVFERAMAWFSANWPEGAVWPDGVPRPERVDGATNSHDGETTARIGPRPVNPARIAQPPMEA